jgi:hypothetical protein
VQQIGAEPVRIPRIWITGQAYSRLRWYIELCPFEVSGIGTVAPHGEDLLVTDIILVRQRASDTDTELDSQAVADHLLQVLQRGEDPSALRVWWHSHAEGDIYWSDTDEETIERFQIDQLISIVGNRRLNFGCRLDQFSPKRLTVNNLPLLPLPEESPGDEESLRQRIMAELREKVTLIRRDVMLVPEVFLDPSSTLEIPIGFDELGQPPRP